MKNAAFGGISLLMLVLSGCGGGAASSTPEPPKTYTVSVSASTGGALALSQSSVTSGQVTTATLSMMEGYQLVSVAGCGGTLADKIFTTAAIQADCKITGEFALKTFQVATEANSGGKISAVASTIEYGKTVTIKIDVNEGYSLNRVGGCGAGELKDNQYTSAPIKEDCKVTATFDKVLVALEGTAAHGATLNGAKIDAKCQNGSTFSVPVTTDSKGRFSGLVPKLDLPCALRVTSTDPVATYYSVATSSGTINVTLLTDLILALASQKTPEEWYSSATWIDVIPQLSAAQKKLEDSLVDHAFKVPVGVFQPFVTPLVVGDATDQLMDQLGVAVTQSSSLQSYSALVDTLKTGDLSSVPLPNGDKELTAEACFNPTLYTSGTVLKLKRDIKSITASNGGKTYGSIRTMTYTNGEIQLENNNPVLTQKFSLLVQAQPEDGKTYEGSSGTRKIRVDLKSKQVSLLSHSYLLDKNNQSTDSIYTDYSFLETYSGIGNNTKFKFPSLQVYALDYATESLFTFSLVFVSGKVYENKDKGTFVSNKKFTGLTQIVRAGKVLNVCEFEVSEKSDLLSLRDGVQTQDGTSGQFNKTRKEYYLQGSGVDVTSDDLVSIVLNDKELLATPLN